MSADETLQTLPTPLVCTGMKLVFMKHLTEHYTPDWTRMCCRYGGGFVWCRCVSSPSFIPPGEIIGVPYSERISCQWHLWLKYERVMVVVMMEVMGRGGQHLEPLSDWYISTHQRTMNRKRSDGAGGTRSHKSWERQSKKNPSIKHHCKDGQEFWEEGARANLSVKQHHQKLSRRLQLWHQQIHMNQRNRICVTQSKGANKTLHWSVR